MANLFPPGMEPELAVSGGLCRHRRYSHQDDPRLHWSVSQLSLFYPFILPQRLYFDNESDLCNSFVIVDFLQRRTQRTLDLPRGIRSKSYAVAD